MTGRVWRRECDEDSGHVSVWTLGWLVLVVLALLVVAAASQIHIERTRLASLADEVALAAVYAADENGYFSDTGNHAGEVAHQSAMGAAVDQWIATDSRPWVAEVVVLSVTGSRDGTTSVQLARTVTPLFGLEALGPFNTGVNVVTTGRARVG